MLFFSIRPRPSYLRHFTCSMSPSFMTFRSHKQFLPIIQHESKGVPQLISYYSALTATSANQQEYFVMKSSPYIITDSSTRAQCIRSIMWDYILVAIGFVSYLYLLFSKNPKSKLEDNVSSPVVKTIGTLEAMFMSLNFLFDKTVPNYEKLDNIGKNYGQIFLFKRPVTGEVNLLVGDLTTARKIMNSSNWMDRLPNGHYLLDVTESKPLGLIFGGGEYWKEARKLTLKILHEIDFYKPQNLEAVILPELDILVNSYLKKLQENNGQFILRVENTFEIHVLNVTSKLMISTRFDHDDPLVIKFQECLIRNGEQFSVGTSAVDVMPWLRYIPGLTWVDTFNQSLEATCNLFLPEINKKRQTGSYRTSPRDFADYFLLEIDKQRGQDGTHITDENFIVSLRDLFTGGSDTSNLAIEYGLLHLSLQPQIQKKVQDEIDAVIGPSRCPTYDDRQRMNYTQAVLLETLRIATPAPLISRSAVTDTYVHQQFIPKGTICGINIYSINRSPENWPESDAFRPERFLNDEGEIINADKILTFGHGKHYCIGAFLVQVFAFMCLVRLLQKFSFRISSEHPPPSLKNRFGLSRGPLPFYLTMHERIPCSDLQ